MTTHTTPTTKPTGYVFLDVDGIINPFDRDLGLDGWTLHKVEDYWVWVGDPVIPRFQRLVEAGVQFVWATTWINTSPGLRKLEKLWGLPPSSRRSTPWSGTPAWTTRPAAASAPASTAGSSPTTSTPTRCRAPGWTTHLGQIDLRWAEARGVKGVRVPSERGLSDPAQVAADRGCPRV